MFSMAVAEPDTSPQDVDLLARFAKGDTAALEALALRLERPMLGLALGLLNGRRDLALDAVQETWVRVIRGASGFRGEASAQTWIYRILVNRCHTLREKVARAPVRSTTPSPSEEIEPEELRALREAVAMVEEPKRTVLLLCYHAGMTHEQAAAVLKVPLGTLKSRLHAALTELRNFLKADER
jgi:RNA polymerase sigma-70 factor, ECF subfamily